MNYLFLTMFWTGVLVIKFRPVNELKERIDSVLGKIKEDTSKSALCLAAEKIRSNIMKEKLTSELLDCLSFIKNIVILGNTASISSALLLEQLSQFSDKLRPVFEDMAKFLNINDKFSAAKCLEDSIGSQIASDIGTFIAGWEDLPPSDILDTVELYQNTLREERLTQLKRKDELVSDLVYFPVVINCMVVLLNFIYVAYFIEQKDLLSILI